MDVGHCKIHIQIERRGETSESVAIGKVVLLKAGKGRGNMGRLSQAFVTLIITGLAAILWISGVQAAPLKSAEQIEQLCQKAEKRYQKYFGKPSSGEGVTIVKMYKYTFCPVQVTIKQGESVRWVNVDFTSHSTWFKQAGKEEGERLFRKESSEMKFDLPPGEYPYLCGPHWESDGMIGKVTVTP